jgi:hypothetical protein
MERFGSGSSTGAPPSTVRLGSFDGATSSFTFTPQINRTGSGGFSRPAPAAYRDSKHHRLYIGFLCVFCICSQSRLLLCLDVSESLLRMMAEPPKNLRHEEQRPYSEAAQEKESFEAMEGVTSSAPKSAKKRGHHEVSGVLHYPLLG